MAIRHFGILMIMCTVWGLHFVIIKLGVAQVPPIFYAAVRMTLVALVMSPFLRWHAGQMKAVLIGGICLGALNYAFMFSGLVYAPANVAALAIELYVPFATLLSVMFLGERVGVWRVGGIALAFCGVGVIALAGHGESVGAPSSDRILLGIGLIMFAALSEAVGAVFVKKVSSISPFQLLAWFALIGTLILWILTGVFETNQWEQLRNAPRTPLLGAILYSAFLASIVGHSIFYWLLQRLPLSLLAPSGLLTTLLAVMFATLLLREPLTLPLIIGGLMILAGVGTVLVRTHAKE